ncbi:hypothetical protein GQ53DRAFT_747558 [Thozetella sp. PMI_491]|nr:hypothetical protein GQ53DRAFT_747558 [Thozetella sp. PMI_491]
MANNAVGFTVQADVIQSASVVYDLAGRTLQAIGNCPVDRHSLAAALWLGRQIPIAPSHETAVYKQLVSRRGTNAIIAKVLNIGWGHTDFALELAKTKAGVSFLILVGALATGSNAHVAAQCLSELLCLASLGTDQVPSIEVLKPLISYLAPPLRDLGFRRVLEHIVSTVERACLAQARETRIPEGLSSLGDASVLAGTIRQLCLTRNLLETAYFATKQRGAWLAAFASQVLGMEVEMRFGEMCVWASGGAYGRAVFQLDETFTGTLAGMRNVIIIPGPQAFQGCRPILVEHAIKDVLEAELARYPNLDTAMHTAVHHAIIRLSLVLRASMTKSIHLDVGSDSIPICNLVINQHFRTMPALFETLSNFNIPRARDHGTDPAFLQGFPTRLPSRDAAEYNGLQYFAPPEIERIRRICPYHSTQAPPPDGTWCYCRELGRLVHGVSTSAIALMYLSYDPSTLRLRSDIANGTIRTSWSESCILAHGAPSANAVVLVKHLGQLLDGAGQFDPENVRDFEWTPQTLGISGGNLTILYRAVLSHDAFDAMGRLLTIVPGVMSANGTVYRRLLENGRSELIHSLNILSKSTRLANGVSVFPHYLPSDLHIDMLVEPVWDDARDSGSISITGQICSPEDAGRMNDQNHFSLLSCLHTFLRAHVPDRCTHLGHDVYGPFNVSDAYGTVKLSTFGKTSDWSDRGTKVVIYPLQGRKLEQIIQASLCLSIPTVQMYCCLTCAVGRDLPPRTMKEVIVAAPEA